MSASNTIDSGLNSAMPGMASVVANSPDFALKQIGGELATKTITLGGGAGVKLYDLFTITGVVEIWGLCGIFTAVTDTTTASTASFIFNDATADTFLTADGGTDASGAVVGALIAKQDVAAANMAFKNANEGGILEEGRYTVTMTTLISKTGATNKVQFEVTQDAATAATIKFTVLWAAVSDTGNVVAA